MLRFTTAGESHGQGLVALVQGLPAGLPVTVEFIDGELRRRQKGYGRGGRMRMERDSAEILAGVRRGETTGAPVAMLIRNRDWENWKDILPVEAGPAGGEAARALTRPRPGHADLAGCLKYNLHDARYILERASARETAARVAAGAVAKLLLRAFEIEIFSHVIAVGSVTLRRTVAFDQVRETAMRPEPEGGSLRCADTETEAAMRAEVDKALGAGDTLGGIFEAVAHGVPPGLGTHANWDERLDGLLAQAVMSIQAVKAVEIGAGVENAVSFGSAVQDLIGYDFGQARFTRASNRAGGVEGGISNGEDIVVRGYLKPISTLRRPLASADLLTKEPAEAAYERSDVCVVPAAGVIGEAMVALVLARCLLEKFGGDSLGETQRNYRGYLEQLRSF
jgi:chorismate synthase